MQLTAANIFLCGISMNQRAMLDLFQVVFVLSLDETTQLQRLDAQGNRGAAARKQILEGRPVSQVEMVAVGAVVLDASLPTPILADKILLEVGNRGRG